MKLFAIYIGGDHPKANIEVHDVRFIAAACILDTYDQLRADWWGTPGTLHIDCWAEIDHVDGYALSLKPEPSTAQEKLYFVNLGGYDGQDFAETHRNIFVVATSNAEAKTKALRSVRMLKDAHRDNLFEADQVFVLDKNVGDRLHIHLQSDRISREPKFVCRYTPIK